MWLAGFYMRTVRPFLDSADGRRFAARQRAASPAIFDRARSLLPFDFHALDWLEESCDERRQLSQQERLYRLLHGWLKIHVPFSIALLVFVVVHVVTACTTERHSEHRETLRQSISSC